MRVEFDASAKAELREAVVWSLREFGPIAARALRSEVRRVITIIADNPRLWAEVAPGIRRALLAKFPYSLIYTIEDGHVRVFAVAHQRRRPGYWRDRIPK